MSEPFWSQFVRIELSWRADNRGNDGRALFVGDIFVGEVLHSQRGPDQEAPWLAWFLNDDDGWEVGWFSTEQEAKDALVDTTLRGLRV